MQDLKLFVKDIGLIHQWVKIEIFLLERQDFHKEIFSVNGFATYVTEQDLL